METRNSKLFKGLTILGIVIIFLASGLFFSCKKIASVLTPSGDNMDEIAKILNGKRISGSLMSRNDENVWAINYNNGVQFFLIDKLPGAQNFNFNSTQSAQIIISIYGVLIKDVNNNKIFLFINNEKESLKKFEVIKSTLNTNYESTSIFGTTIVNSEKS